MSEPTDPDVIEARRRRDAAEADLAEEIAAAERKMIIAELERRVRENAREGYKFARHARERGRLP